MSAIDTFADDLLIRMLERSPDLAAEMGLRAVGDRSLPQDGLPGFSDAGSEARTAMMADAADRLDRIPLPSTGEDAITWRTLRYVLDDGMFSVFRGRAGHRFIDQPYPVNHLSGFHPVLLMLLSRDHMVASIADADAWLARLARVPDACVGVLDALHARKAKGVRAPRFTLQRSLADIAEFLAPPADGNILVTSFAGKLLQAGIETQQRGALLAAAARTVETEIYPAYRRIAAAVEDLIAASAEEHGVWALPDGDAYYAWLLRALTTSDVSSDAAHAIGLEEIVRVQSEIRMRFASLGIHGNTMGELYAQISDGLRHRFAPGEAGRGEVWSAATTLMRRFESATTHLFRTMPRGNLELAQIPPELEGSMHTHYTPPAADGSRPGRFSLNIRVAQGNPRWELATLCAHEGTPGHHLQLAIAQELPIASAFRRTVVFDAYIEGWAKYAETIPENHDLLNDPLARLGRLRAELYSTVNLALDTGVHAKRWTRDRARTFFRENTGVSDDFAGVIADRCLVSPGQLCSYKVGMMAFLAARDRFAAAGRDLRDFHDCVLGHGALPLRVLEDVVSANLNGGVS